MNKIYSLLIFSFLFSSCSTITLREGLRIDEKADWLGSGRGEGNTNISSSEIKLNPPFKLIWSYNAESGFPKNSLAVSDGVLFAGCLSGSVQAVNLKNGSGIGKASTKSKSCYSNPLILKNIIVLAFGDGEENFITGYDFKKGVFKWKTSTDRIMSSPVIKNELVYYADTKGGVYSVNAETGEKKRIYKNENPFFTSPVLCGGLLVTGDSKGILTAVDIINENSAWTFKTGGGIYSDVSFRNNRYFFGSDDGFFYCLDSAGSLVWKKNLSTKFLSSCSFYSDNVITAGVNGKIYSLNIISGETSWEVQTGGAFSASPVVNDDKIFIGSFDMHFYCLDAKNGRVLWKYNLEDRIRTTAVIWKKFILVANDDKSIYCFQ
ncbi:MAG: PQQ-binding-like beta-propeller repeat protein [Ignavibacteriae bacterium]|nr:PQQ-binding-like beta-propeller repeat protein [Ignavibacteriota bacterium]